MYILPAAVSAVLVIDSTIPSYLNIIVPAEFRNLKLCGEPITGIEPIDGIGFAVFEISGSCNLCISPPAFKKIPD